MLKSLDHAKLGALCGAGLFLCLWLGMLGTLGEILLLLPVSYVLDVIFSSLGIADGQPIFWRVISAILSAATSALVGARVGPTAFPLIEKLPPSRRKSVKVFIPLMILIIIFLGRHLRIH